MHVLKLCPRSVAPEMVQVAGGGDLCYSTLTKEAVLPNSYSHPL